MLSLCPFIPAHLHILSLKYNWQISYTDNTQTLTHSVFFSLPFFLWMFADTPSCVALSQPPLLKCRCDRTSPPSHPLYFSHPRSFFVSEWSLPQRWHLISISLTSQTCNICSSSLLHSSTCDLPTAVQSHSLCHFLCRHSVPLADPLEFEIQMYQSHGTASSNLKKKTHTVTRTKKDL